MVQPLMVHLWVKLSACVKDLGNRQQAAFRHLTTCFCLRSLSRSVPGGLRPVTAHEHGALGGQRAQTTPSPDRHSVGKRKAGAELGQRAGAGWLPEDASPPLKQKESWGPEPHLLTPGFIQLRPLNLPQEASIYSSRLRKKIRQSLSYYCYKTTNTNLGDNIA